MRTFRIPLRVVFYKEEGAWIAHCLEFDLCGDGTTKQDAVNGLIEAMRVQVECSLENNNPANLFSPAPSEVQEKFFAGKHTATGELKIEIEFEPVDHVIIESTEYREYSEEFAGSDSDCVLA